jgi:hypothetical protein
MPAVTIKDATVRRKTAWSKLLNGFHRPSPTRTRRSWCDESRFTTSRTWVGDMHQPLHAGRAGDQGGVDIPVSYRNATTNLHYFWDSDLVEMETGSEEDIAKQLTANLTEEEHLKWQASDPTQWTNESLMLVRSYTYNTGPSNELSDDYVEKARPIVQQRLAQAGIRLAWLLNTAFN